MKAANGTARPCSQLGGFLKQEAPTDSDDYEDYTGGLE